MATRLFSWTKLVQQWDVPLRPFFNSSRLNSPGTPLSACLKVVAWAQSWRLNPKTRKNKKCSSLV